MRAELISGAGNHFVLLDARGGEAPDVVEVKSWCEAAAVPMQRAVPMAWRRCAS